MSCLSASRRRLAIAGLVATAVFAATFRARAELPEWVRNVDATARFHDAIFRTVATPSGPVEVRRAPADVHDTLARMPGGAADLELFAVRARAAEEKLDAEAAEADWRAYAAASPDAAAGQLALADFYHRRLLPQKEADALAAAAQLPDPQSDRLLRASERRSWRAFERLFALIDAQQLRDAFGEAQCRAWIGRFPQEAPPYERLFHFLLDRDHTSEAETLLADYHKAFPTDEASLLKNRAELAVHRGATADALAVYERAFRPLWDADLVQGYFDLLERTHGLRLFIDRARADIAARPADLTPVARVFYYYQRAGNIGAAEQALADFEGRRDSAQRTADELFTLAHLYEKTRNGNEALRYYSSIYSMPDAGDAAAEQALASIIGTLFAVPEQPLRFGSGDLSFYRDIATLDRYPGFLNGVLSLLFNSASPRFQYAQQETKATSYFHRARAADLLGLFETRFPGSSRRPELNATLVATYAAYGESDAVIDRGRRFLADFPDVPQRTTVALAMADAFARKEQVADEFGAYDRLLQELAARADRVPIGAGAGATRTEARAQPQSAGPRSQEYARVLDRYIARLVARKQLPDAFAVYRREIDRNPDDPGLYAAAGQFLEQNNFTAEVEQVYRLAIQQFPDRSWHQRLARWYLRQRQAAAFDTLTRDITRTFDGTDLARYFAAVVARGPSVNAQLFLQVNLYAHDRFPHHLIFVRNLLSAYSTRDTLNAAAHEALLRRHWFEDEQLSAEFFATLSRTNRLDAEIAGVRGLDDPADQGDWSGLAKKNPVGARFLAEADIWRSRFETGAPPLTALAAEYPAEAELGQRVASLHRSLSYADERETDAAARAEERIHRYDPRNATALTTLGEIYADRERYDEARVNWNGLPDIEPGRAAGYLDSATVFWDYYQFADALRIIALGRTRLRTPALHAYEAGAIYESLRQSERAVDEYARGALAGQGNVPAHRRLLVLAKRPAYRDLADRASAAASDGDAPPAAAVSLRIAVLEAQDRRADLERFLLALLDRTSSLEVMTEVGSHAERLGFESVRTRSIGRQIEVMTDPIDRLQLRYALARLYESRGELDQARTTLETLYAENPRILGVVRQTADYYWRHDLRREAVAVLTRAASSSHPALKKQFTFEAAQKSTEIGNQAQARDLLTPLLADDPFNADYLAAVADTYARAQEDGPLRDFYRATIDAMSSAPVTADERTRRIAGLRRGLIPALARLSDYAGAVDQYIEIANRFPDDEKLLQEAGRFARQHGRTGQLIAYYTKTAADSPRDYRWPMLLAKLETQFEDFPAAIAAYAKAAAIRPDRADFHTARAGLEERLMRFDDAITSYRTTYELTYHDRQWMERMAELHARQGRVDEAAKALRTAFVDGRPEGPEAFFAAARRLEQWHMLDAARPFVDEGARLAGPAGLLERGGTYVTVYTRLRQTTAAFDRLLAAFAEAQTTARTGNRAPLVNGLSARLRDMGDIVASDFGPEEKAAFAVFLGQKKATAQRADVERVLLPLADRAGLSDLTVAWRTELMEADRQSQPNGYVTSLVEMQTGRLRFAELATALERFAGLGGPMVFPARIQAAEAYRKAGDPSAELRLLSSIPAINLPAPLLARYFELLLERDPLRLVALTGAGQASMRDAVASYVVGHGTVDQALAAVRARGQGLPPVWTNAYTALVGLHFGRFDAATTDAFTAVLGAGTVEGWLKPVDRSVRLAGDAWFAYGSRFGEYLTLAKLPDADDYLSADIERTPARSDAYVSVSYTHLTLPTIYSV